MHSQLEQLAVAGRGPRPAANHARARLPAGILAGDSAAVLEGAGGPPPDRTEGPLGALRAALGSPSREEAVA